MMDRMKCLYAHLRTELYNYVCTCMHIFVCVCVVFCSFSSAAPGAPSGVTITDFNDTTVTLSWTPPASDGGRPDDLFYIIQYQAIGGPVNYYSPMPRIMENSVTITKLTQVTTYKFKVIAGNKVTEENFNVFPVKSSPTSNEVTVTTKPSRELHT